VNDTKGFSGKTKLGSNGHIMRKKKSKKRRVPKFFPLSSLTCNQILLYLMGDHGPTNLANLKKKKKNTPLEQSVEKCHFRIPDSFNTN
jgi:hypothetical protein